MGLFSLFVSIPPSLLFHFSIFVFLILSLSLCVHVWWSVSQADDDSSQTSPDYTVRPNINIDNIGEWFHICFWVAENEQEPIARCWSIFGCSCKAWFVYQSLWKGTNHLLFLILWLAKKIHFEKRPLLDEWKFYFLPMRVAQNGKQHEHISNDIHLLSHTQTANSNDFIYTIYSVFTVICLENQRCI